MCIRDRDKSNYYNPFQYIDPKRSDFEENILTLIDTIIVNTDGGEKKGSSDPFWDKAEKLFLQSIFFLVATAFPKEMCIRDSHYCSDNNFYY